MKLRQFIKKMMVVSIAGVLSCQCINTSVIKAEEKSEEDIIYFEGDIQADDGHIYTGSFAVYEKELYILDSSVTEMAEDISEMRYVIGNDNADYSISRGNIRLEFSKSETCGDYLPFKETLTFLSLYPVYDERNQILKIKETKNLHDLDAAMLEMYEAKEYNMAYWQNTEDMGGYDTHVSLAKLADCVKNWNYINYLTGAEQENQYERAFWNVIIQNEDPSDDASFIHATAEAGKTVNDTYGLLDDVVEDLDKILEDGFSVYEDELSDSLSSFGDAVEYMQIEELAETIRYASIVGNEEDNCVRGIDLVINSSYVSTSKQKMADIGKKVLKEYRGKNPLWKEALEDVARGAVKDLEGEIIWDGVIYGKSFADLTNKLADEVLGTQNQVDATIAAAAALEVQELCGRYYYNMRNEYKKAYNNKDWEGYAKYLQNAKDAMIAYLQCGAEAYRAMAIDSELNVMSKNTIKKINDATVLLSSYMDADFEIGSEMEEAHGVALAYGLEKYYSQKLEAETEVVSGNPLLSVTWDTSAVDMISNMPYEMDYYVEGISADGTMHTYSESDGCYYDAAGNITAKKTYSEGQTLLEIYDMQSSFLIHVENSNYPTNGWLDYAAVSYTSPAGEVQGIGEDYLLYGGPGIWYYGMNIEQGNLKTAAY